MNFHQQEGFAMKRWVQATFLVVPVLVVGVGYAVDRQGIVAQDEETRTQTRQQIVKERQETIRYLLEVILSRRMQEEKRPAVVAAIELLGELRASEAVPALADLLLYGERKELEYSPVMTELRVPRLHFPAVRALIKIGVPALDEMARRIAETPTPFPGAIVKGHCRVVITEVLGSDLAAEFLRIKSTQTDVPEQKQRLLETRDHVLKIQQAIKENTQHE